MKNTRLTDAIKNRQLVKAIAGIDNTNMDIIANVIEAANAAGVTAVDVNASVEVVRYAKANSNALVFASSTNAQELLAAVNAGADVAEVGNFDAMYKQNNFLTLNDVLNIARETVELLPNTTPICVTVPGFLNETEQAQLVAELEKLGVDLIQTEGVSRDIQNAHPMTMTAEEKALASTRNVRALTQITNIPVMAASGMAPNTVKAAMEAGAVGVGIGAAINSLTTAADMTEVLNEINAAVGINNRLTVVA